MAINSLNKILTGQTTGGSFGPVPAGKEWIIKQVSAEVTTAGALAEVEFEVNSVVVGVTGPLGSIGDIGHMVGSDQPDAQAIVATNPIATDGQSVDINRTSGGGFTWSAIMSYVERDIP